MYAIIQTGGKQYKVQPGDRVRVEKLDHKLGEEITLTDVLMIGGETTVLGQPTVKDAKVTAVITRQEKNDKVIIFKKKRRQGYRRFKTHRQPYTELFIKAITSPEGKVAKTDEQAPVVNLAEKRTAKLAEKAQAREEAMKAARESGAHDAPVKKVAAKKKTTKKATAKKAGKKKTAKKAGAKKTTKKASKK